MSLQGFPQEIIARARRQSLRMMARHLHDPRHERIARPWAPSIKQRHLMLAYRFFGVT
jgi:hypothetical protein